MSTSVEQIKERLGIVDVVSSYIHLTKAGSSYKATCPFHNEKTPSFFVSPARNSFYCFGCQKGGDIFSFVQEFEGLDFVGALRVLASRAGVELKRVDPKVQSQFARLYLLLEKATRFFEEQLEKNSEARAYLAVRGLTPDTVRAWRLGFAPNEWRRLLEHLEKEGFKPEEMEKVGLVKRKGLETFPRSSGKMREGVVPLTTPHSPPLKGGEARYYDAFRGRVMFPIRDGAGRVIGFSGRILPKLDDGTLGKYINSPETVLFNKSETLHGFDKAKLAIRQKDAAILVEGQMDLTLAHQAGYENTVASSGTALTERQLQKLKRLSENLLLAFDSDSAGLRASERAIRLALSFGMNVKVIALKEKDPAELIQREPKEWKRVVSEAKHVIDFLLDALLASAKESRERALAIEKQLLPLARLLPSSVEQSHFLKVIAERSGLREESLWEAFKKLSPASERFGLASEKRANLGEAKNPMGKHSSAVARRVFATLLHSEERKEQAVFERLAGELARIFGKDEFEKRRSEHAALREPLLAEAEALYGDATPSVREEAELLRHLEEEELAAKLQAVMDKLAQSERAQDKQESEKLLREAKSLSERLAALKSVRFSH
ncbi:MAG: CHC2 zinc finger domain-containing protein [Patescibacteria group bacterium]